MTVRFFYGISILMISEPAWGLNFLQSRSSFNMIASRFDLNLPVLSAQLQDNNYGTFESKNNESDYRTEGFGIEIGGGFLDLIHLGYGLQYFAEETNNVTYAGNLLKIDGSIHYIYLNLGVSRGLINIDLINLVGNLAMDMSLRRSDVSVENNLVSTGMLIEKYKASNLVYGYFADFYTIIYGSSRLGARVGYLKSTQKLKFYSTHNTSSIIGGDDLNQLQTALIFSFYN